DLFFWGGPTQVRLLAKHCETFGIGLSLHSDRELGIGTIAGAHFVAATPNLTHAADSHYPDQTDDILTERLQFVDGCLELPKGPGLGVAIDPEKLEKYHRLYLEVGDSVEFFDQRRPDWIPHLPLF
ncbi:MAG TPA: enolase C-terminal domain-like protein, partial [Limnochordia bacterium]|nr:enolase C-terminal domain-like protein [Limnochordia bacterium]